MTQCFGNGLGIGLVKAPMETVMCRQGEEPGREGMMLSECLDLPRKRPPSSLVREEDGVRDFKQSCSVTSCVCALLTTFQAFKNGGNFPGLLRGS